LNAAVDLEAAGELIDPLSKVMRKFDRLFPAYPLDGKEMLVIERTLMASRDALRRLEVAMTKPQVHWKQSYESPVRRQDERWMKCSMRLPCLLRAAALRSHQLGDDAAALARVGQMLFIARAVDRDPWFAAHLEAGGVRALACDAILQIAPELLMGEGRGDADARVRALIQELMEDSADHQSLIRAMQAERMRACDLIRAYAAGHSELMGNRSEEDLESRSTRLMVLPFVLNDGPVVLKHATQVIEAARSASTWPAVRSSAPDLHRPAEAGESPTPHSLVCVFMPQFEWPLRAHFRAVTERRLAATALAMRLFAAEHDGRIPADLEELVPSYLATLPVDPMSAGGRRVGYIPAAGNPILYSVGDDGNDDGGNAEPIRAGTTGGSYGIEWDTRDVVVHLSRQARVRVDDDDD
jgi:hypothetical protein